jgi:glycyl-tRNA synthetase
MSSTAEAAPTTMDTIVALCKRRGFIFQSSDIYGGFNGFFDYGPLGAQMKKNIKDAWWKDMVESRDDVVGLDSSIIMHPKTWEASGHIGGFSDPMVDCKASKMRYRADQLFFAPVLVEDEPIGYISVLESEHKETEAQKLAESLKRKLAKQGLLAPLVLKPYTEASPEEYDHIPSPATQKPGSLTPPRAFNLMFQTHVGALSDATTLSYLRPETAQGIFVNFKNVLDSSRQKIPFGIAQIGKAFRNEITPRNFVFRSREFEQMELEYFIPNDESWKHFHEEWVSTRLKWLESIGLDPKRIHLQKHEGKDLAHYARACTDILFEFPFGRQELEGVAARGNFDLSQHSTHSGKALEYFDEETKQRYIPHVIEPSLGVERLFLALLCSAYKEDIVDGEKRNFLQLHPRIAPIQVAVLPLVKNKEAIVEKAEAIYKGLQKHWRVFYDASGAIGRRYRRMDEIGTPFCLTVDFESLENNTLTLRYRDSTQQERVSIDALPSHLAKLSEGLSLVS